MQAVGDRVGVTREAIRQTFNRHKILKRKRWGKVITRTELERLYVDQGLDVRVVASTLRTNVEKVKESLRQFNIPIRNVGKPRQAPPVSKRTLSGLYRTKTQKEIAEILEVSQPTVSAWLRYYGIR